VQGITLFIFGGVAQIGEEPRSPASEFRIAIAGPLVSFGLAGLFGGIGFVSQTFAAIAIPSLYLARINLILALFNMIPGFPLDGGRVLRALIWGFSNSFERATRIATWSGQVVAYGFIGFGLVSVVLGQISSGLWLAFIGWFLQNAANSAASQLSVQQRLRGVTVGQAMSRDCAAVSALTPLSQLVHNQVLTDGQHCFFVVDANGQPYGMLTLRDITQVPQIKWRFTTADQVMKPLYRLLHLDPAMELLSALKKMEAANLAEMPVVYQDRPVGMLSRERVMRYLRLRNELGI
jgi:CBS domain-containing protein